MKQAGIVFGNGTEDKDAVKETNDSDDVKEQGGRSSPGNDMRYEKNFRNAAEI